jgi:hypothetical protein
MPQKPKNGTTYGHSVPFWGIYPRESNPAFKRDICTPRFIVIVFTVAKLWNQLGCPSMDGWTKKMWCIYTMEYYSTIKKNEIMSCAGKWMELEIMILSKISPHSERQISCAFSHMLNLDEKRT